MRRHHGGRPISSRRVRRSRRLWWAHGMPGWTWRWYTYQVNYSEETISIDGRAC